MPLNLIFVSAGNYTIEDDGIPGNNTSVIKDASGAVIFTFVHPADSLQFTCAVPGVNITVNITDSLGAANFTIGSLTDGSQSPDSIAIRNVATTGIVTLAANGSISEAGSDAAADIIAGQLILSAGTGIGAGNALETQVASLEAETGTGGISITNFGTVQIGGISADVNGLDVTTSGDINFTNYGSIQLGDQTGLQTVHGGSSSGDVTLTAFGPDADIFANANNDAITAAGGSIFLTAGRDIDFGTVGSNFDNDVRARGGVIVNAGRDFVIDGFADLASDDFGGNTGGNVVINAGRNIQVRSLTGTDGSIFANGNAGADVILTTGINGALIVDPVSIGSQQPVSSNSGDVVIAADRILINTSSGIGAPNGEVSILTRTPGRAINLGSAGDGALAIELSNGEVGRIFTPNLRIGDGNSGGMTVSAAINFANATNVILRSGADLTLNGDLTLAGALSLRAGDNLLGLAGAINAGSVNAIVDEFGNEGAIGTFGGAVTGSGLTLFGSGGNDVLRGVEGRDQVVHGFGGNDTITSSGEGQYFGDEGNDLIFAGLTAGFAEILDGGAGIDTLDTTSFPGNYTINLVTGTTNFGETFVNFENLVAGAGNDTLTGTAGDNLINGGGGSDSIFGNGGIDTLTGGAGDDFLYVDSATDSVVEFGGGGNDRVITSVSYALAASNASIETLVTTDNAGTTAINLTGNFLIQTIIGNDGANTIDGGGGGDTMVGLGSDDVYFVRSAADRTVEAASGGSDRLFAAVSFVLEANSSVEIMSTIDQAATTAINLTGNNLAQFITGNAGANTLDGGGGGDTMVGFCGDDFYIIRNAADRAVEAAAGGSDRVFAAVSFALEAGSSVEIVSTTDNAGVSAINLTGNELAQAVFGNAGGNILDGGGGGDTMVGLGGNDFYFIRDAADRAVEAAAGGTDRVFAAVSFALEAGSEVETLSTIDQTASTAVNLAGNALTQSIIGNAGANTLDSGGGGDVMVGLGGDDFYFVRAAGDRAVEAAGAGNDRVFAAVSFGLEAGSSIETLSTIFNGDTSAINLTGNELAQTIFGNAGANILDGKGGLDTLTGFGGADIFTFTTALGAGNIDQIADFVSGTDRIAIDDAIFTGLAPGALPATAFVIGASAGDADDRIIYNNATGALFFDADGNGAGAAVQFATLSGAPALAAADFAVI